MVNKKMKNNLDFNEEKFKSVLHYIISKVGNKPNVGKTVLFKLLYFSDFDFYEKHETYLSGASYRAIKGGPAPLPFDKTIKELIDERKVKYIRGIKKIFLPEKYFSLVEADLSSISQGEIQVINSVLDRYSSFNATKISRLVHSDIPWKATEDKEIINYELVFYRDSFFSVLGEEGMANCIQ